MQKKYNNLEIQSISLIDGHTVAYCKCLLCGNFCNKKLSMIKIGHIKSCGCLSKLTRFQKGYGIQPINFFDDLNSEAVNYWSGFLFGDGCIDSKNKLQVCLSSNNGGLEHLIKLSNFLVGNDICNNYQKKFKCHLQITNEILANNFKKFGITPNKTYSSALKIPNKNMSHHVIRGYFDADGWFTNRFYKGYQKPVWGLCSYLPENLEIVVSYLPHKPNIKKLNRQNQLYEIRFQKVSKIIDTINYLEPVDKSLCLMCKWEKLWKFKNDYSKSPITNFT